MTSIPPHPLSLLFLLLATSAQADTLGSRLTGRSLQDEGNMSIGYEDWRLRNPHLTRQQSPLESLPPSAMPILETINTKINRQIRYQPDTGPDHWDTNPPKGDCDDYMVTKLSALVAAGIPRSALRIVVAVTDQGDLHGVLAVDIGNTTVILDNPHHPTIELWTDRTDLTFKAMEVVNAYGLTYLATLQ